MAFARFARVERRNPLSQNTVPRVHNSFYSDPLKRQAEPIEAVAVSRGVVSHLRQLRGAPESLPAGTPLTERNPLQIEAGSRTTELRARAAAWGSAAAVSRKAAQPPRRASATPRCVALPQTQSSMQDRLERTLLGVTLPDAVMTDTLLLQGSRSHEWFNVNPEGIRKVILHA